jgi:hypothetical protein
VLDPSITGHNGLLALSGSAWWWTGIIPAAILMLRGHTRRMDFRTLMGARSSCASWGPTVLTITRMG